MISPQEMREEVPLSGEVRKEISRVRNILRKALVEGDERFVIFAGPCSIHDTDTALEYARRIESLQGKYEDTFIFVMRTYVEKPRSTTGWKGFVSDPDLNGSNNIEKGLRATRKLLADIAEIGVACGIELFHPLTHLYYDDLVSWASIGARTAESQVHREEISALEIPTGFKNNTEGNINVALDGMEAAAASHTFLSLNEKGCIDAIISAGNPDTHMILRGGRRGSNYSKDAIESVIANAKERKLNPYLTVDCSHGNSGKNTDKQTGVAQKVVSLRSEGLREIAGIMLESNIEGGAQSIDDGRKNPHISITDPCLGWEETVELLNTIYKTL